MAEAKFMREDDKLEREYLKTDKNSENQWAVST